MTGRGSLEETGVPSTKEILAQRVKRPRIEDHHPSLLSTTDATENLEAALAILPLTSVPPFTIGSERKDLPPSSFGASAPAGDVDHFNKILEVITSHLIFSSVSFLFKHLSFVNSLTLFFFFSTFLLSKTLWPKKSQNALLAK